MANQPQAMSQIELHFKGRKLVNVESFHKVSPVLLVYFQNSNGGVEFVGQTERMENNQNPDWALSVMVDYYFEEEQKILCKVVDAQDREKISFSDAPCIGQYTFALGKLVSAQGQKLSGNLTLSGKAQARGQLTVHGEVTEASNKIAIMRFSCEKVPKAPRLCCLPDSRPLPSLVLRRVREDGEWVKVNETGAPSPPDRTCDPSWSEFEADVGRLCNGDLDRPLKVEVADIRRGNDNPPILCEIETTLRALESADGQGLRLTSTMRDQTPCTLQSSVRLIQMPTFLDYLSGGLDLNLHIGIDFTGSNRNPMDPASLHCLLNPNSHNQYQQVIQSVGSILQHYDTDQKFPVWGFGARVDHHVSHCFPCNPDGQEVEGLAGIHKAYLAAVERVQFSGPTLFAPLINRLIADVQHTQHSQPLAYHVMLILTDGCIHDMTQTIDAIVRSSALPISLIIVGIGEEDFSNMEALDADASRLRASNGDWQKHDNVQFVPYASVGQSSCRLAREVLMELPQQVVTHFKLRNISPPPPRADTHAAAFHRGDTVTSLDNVTPTYEAAATPSYANQAFVTAVPVTAASAPGYP